jgi:hypothetical protein
VAVDNLYHEIHRFFDLDVGVERNYGEDEAILFITATYSCFSAGSFKSDPFKITKGGKSLILL